MKMSNPYHYIESGLDNVYISGMPSEKDDAGEDIITIPFVNKLHKIISLGIVLHNKGMDGSELRFLRTEMGMTRAELAVTVHRDKQTIGRWERNENEIDSNSEVIIRRLAIEQLNLKVELGIEELVRKSVATTEKQSINIQKSNDNTVPYKLMEAA